MLRLQVWASAVMLAVLCLVPSDMERYWLAFAGDWSLAHGRILESLQGSWYPNRSWVDQEWLVSIATAWTRAHGIYVLLELLFAASMVAGIVFVAYESVRTKTHPLIACAQVGVASIGAVFFAQDRAQTLVWALLPALILLWRSKPWYAVPLLALWANVHGSFPIAILWMLLHLDRRRAAPFVVATLATLANPLGWHLWVFAVELARNARLAGYLSEWTPALQSSTGIVVALLALGPLWLRLGAGVRVNRPVRLGDLLFIAACTLGTIIAIRYSMLLFLTTATAFGESFGTSAKPMPIVTRVAGAFFIAITLVLTVKRLVAAPIVADPNFHTLESGVSFTQCVPLVRARRVFTDELQIGSLVELAGGHPNVDGRIDAFPHAAIRDSIDVLNHPGSARPIVQRSGADMLAIAGPFQPPPPWRQLARCGSVRLYTESSGTRSPSKKTPS